jgi:hypothetical protein
MAARTCLLCGKALSRIWADKGEEFCSREHRNQYRLRRGMDRLMEANAVANVMRRREIPKAIPVGDLRAPGPASPRGFLDTLRRPLAEVSTPASKIQGRPRLVGSSRFRLERALADTAVESKELLQAVRFPGPAARAPRIALRLPAHVMPAPPARTRPFDAAPGDRRNPSIRWRGNGKPVITALLARAEARSAALLPESRPARRLTTPRVGRELKVSTAAGFRLPERAFPATRFPAPEVHGLPTPREKRFKPSAAPRVLTPNILVIENTPVEMRIPPPPSPELGRRLRWPGAFEISIQFLDAANETRALAVPFGVPDDSVKERK